jgi:hypothetical protein
MAASRGVIVFLTQKQHSSYKSNTLMEINRSVSFLYRFYNSEQQDDVIFFHTGEMGDLEQSRILSLCDTSNSTARFLDVGEYFRLPPGVPDASKWRFRARFSAGYRHMIRFFTVGLWPIVARQGYDYVMRLDADSYLLSPIRYNLFRFMHARGFEYGFRMAAWEDGLGTHGERFQTFVREYAMKYHITPTWLLDSCPETSRKLELYSRGACGSPYAAYNNFFITKVSFWTSASVQHFLRHIDASHTIYTERYGDLLWHAVTMQLFMPQLKAHLFTDFAYEHVSVRHFTYRGSRRSCTLYGGVVVPPGDKPDLIFARERLNRLVRIPRCPEGPKRCYMKPLGTGARENISGIGFGFVSEESPNCSGLRPPMYCGVTARGENAMKAAWHINNCITRANMLGKHNETAIKMSHTTSATAAEPEHSALHQAGNAAPITGAELAASETPARKANTSAELTASETLHLSNFARALEQHDYCDNTETASTLQAVLHREFTAAETRAWRQPKKGVWRPTRIGGPCPDTANWWVPTPARWQARPMWAHCCDKGAGVARCPEALIETPSRCKSKLDGLSRRCEDDATLLCKPFFQPNSGSPCLVYSFGIAEQWAFEDWVSSAFGCEVHAFDPTTKTRSRHEEHTHANVTFHYMGLAARSQIQGGNALRRSSPGYGRLGGQMVALDDLMRALHHEGRQLSMLKIDCEGEKQSALSASQSVLQPPVSPSVCLHTGCEFGAFVDVAKRAPHVVANVCTLIFEVHFSKILGLKGIDRLRLAARFWEHYVVHLGFRLWFVHRNPGDGHTEPVLEPKLVELGMDGTTCCYEVGLYRPGCVGAV